MTQMAQMTQMTQMVGWRSGGRGRRLPARTSHTGTRVIERHENESPKESV